MNSRSVRMRSRLRPHGTAQPTGFDERLFTTALIMAVAGVPLAMGGRHPIGQAVLTAAAALAVMACLFRRFGGDGTRQAGAAGGFRIGFVEMFAALATIIGFLQLLPLPHRILAAVSPRTDAILPLFSGAPGPGGMGEWSRLSLVPGETITGLGIILAQVILVTIIAQRVRQVADAERVLTVVAGITAVLAMLGIAQYIAGNGRFLWVYDHVYADAGGVVKGTFSNRNHYASFLASGLGAVLWWALHPRDAAAPAGGLRPQRSNGWSTGHVSRSPLEQLGAWRSGIGLLCAALVMFAALSSLSRGGTIALGAAALVSVAVLATAGVVRPAAAAALAAAGMFAAAALQIHGLDRLSGRLDDLFDVAFLDDGFSRLEVWKAACRAIGDFPVFGTGIGSHAEVSPLYMPPTGSTIYTHAENSYLNLGVETGLVGLGIAVAALLVGLVACAILACKGTPRERAVTAALAAGLVASAVHAAGDFVWYVPACSTLAMVFGACAASLAANHVRLFAPLSVGIDRVSAVIVAGFFAIVLGGIGARQLVAVRVEPEWETAIRENRKLAAAAGEQADADALSVGLGRVIAALERVVKVRPDHPRAWAMLALSRLERFGLERRVRDDAATLVDLREAAAAAAFASRAELIGWLRSTAPEDAGQLELAAEEARRAVHACPLAGDAWCVLAALSFLESPDQAVAAARVAQAVRVRPQDGRVLFEAGSQAALVDDREQAVDWWRKSFATGPDMRGRILGILAGLNVSPLEACDLLAPDLDGLRAIDSAWSRTAAEESLREVRSRRLEAVLAAAATAGQRETTASLYLEAASLQRRLGEGDAARRSLDAAVRVAPGSYAAHLARADHAIDEADWETARSEVEWCLMRRPENRQLHDRLKAVAREQANLPADAVPRPPRQAANRP